MWFEVFYGIKFFFFFFFITHIYIYILLLPKRFSEHKAVEGVEMLIRKLVRFCIGERKRIERIDCQDRFATNIRFCRE